MADKILCPWCGTEMHHCGIKRTYDWEGHEMCGKCGATSPKRWAISQDAVRAQSKAAALRRYTPPLKPMTWEEVKSASECAWIEDKKFACTSGYRSPDGVRGWAKLLKEDYGKTWRCWERQPTDEERSAAEWQE